MRFLACLVVLAVCCLLGPGCALFNKKPSDPKTPAAGTGAGTPPAKFPTNNDPLLNGGNVSQAAGGAILAGRVIDNFSRPPSNTSIRLVSMDGKEASNPTDVNVTPEGYFTIQGLKSGASYKLLARGKNGERVLAGITYTRAPNLTVVIQVKEDFANSATPDVQGAPAFQGTSPTKTSGLGNSNNFGSNTASTTGLFDMPAVNVPGPGLPPPTSVPANQGWTPAANIASDKGNFWPPPLDIANPTSKPPPPALFIPKTTPPPPATFNPFPGDNRLDGPARVPSCVLVGKQLINFALNDVNGDPWEFKSNRRGRLVMLDFWSTTCIPCRETVPALRQLQSMYGNQGFEVVGIAIESGGSTQEQAYRVNALAQRLQINYRQLLSGSSQCPVRTQFRIQAVPTMVLVDQNGWILWRHQGQPDRNTLDELERLIQRKLATR